MNEMDYSIFIKKVAEQLLERGWNKIETYNEKIDLAATHDETTALITTKRIVAFLNGDKLTKDEMDQVLESVHKVRKKAALPPLCPATNVLVFVFSNPHDVEWIIEKAKKRDIFTTNYTVSWVVDLNKRSLKKHKGLPIINSGTTEIQATLSVTG